MRKFYFSLQSVFLYSDARPHLLIRCLDNLIIEYANAFLCIPPPGPVILTFSQTLVLRSRSRCKEFLLWRNSSVRRLFHAVDWFPTMAHVAGVPPSLSKSHAASTRAKA